jgi:hypothetical protein
MGDLSYRELAERCRDATAPDWGLAATIVAMHFRNDIDMLAAVETGAFDPTRSLTAAAFLIPPGYEWAVGHEDGVAFAGVHKPDEYSESVEAATPALALTAAALFARAGDQ